MAAKGQVSSVEVDAWVRETLPRAVAYARSLLRDAVAAEDVAHDCYCRLLRRADVYDLPRDGTKLLYRSITNASINRYQRERNLLSLDAPGLNDKPIGDAVLTDRSPQPDERLRVRELELAIERAMETLSVMQRAALQLKALGHSVQDIADTLGLTATNVGVLIHRARQTMAVELAPFLEEKSRMTERIGYSPDNIELLLVDHLDRQATVLDFSPLLERIRSTVLAEQPVSPVVEKPRSLRWLRWMAGVGAAACLLIGALMFWQSERPVSAASPQALLQETQKTFHQPVYRCYLVEVQRETDLTDDSNPFVAKSKQTRLWTSGDRFWIETFFPEFPMRRNYWGRDKEETIWMTFGPRDGILLKPTETPKWLSVYCDLCSMQPDRLIADVLWDFDLKREDSAAGASTHIVKADLKPGRFHPGIKSAVLELDAETKVLRKVVLHRPAPGGINIITTYTLVETKNQDELQYPLDGREGKREFFTADYKPEIRQKLLLPLFGQRAAEWLKLPPKKFDPKF